MGVDIGHWYRHMNIKDTTSFTSAVKIFIIAQTVSMFLNHLPATETFRYTKRLFISHHRKCHFTCVHRTEKTPTVLLLNPDTKFHSFGYEAETKYAQLSEKQMHKDWYYFQNFKMKLYGDRVNLY